MRFVRVAAALLSLASVPGAALAQVHATDFIARIHPADSQLEFGGVDVDGLVQYPVHVKAQQLGLDGVPNFSSDPGFDSEPGALVPGLRIGFDILSAVRAWDGQDFDAIAAERITVRKAGVNIESPSTDEIVPGFVFGVADNDANAVFHHHVQFFVDFGNPNPIDGVWLLELGLWTEDSVVIDADPIWIVFGQGSGADQLDDAVRWVEDNLVGSPCRVDLNGDDTLDFFDVSLFLQRFNAGDPSADFNDDGRFDFFDISAFLAEFSAGCD